MLLSSVNEFLWAGPTKSRIMDTRLCTSQLTNGVNFADMIHEISPPNVDSDLGDGQLISTLFCLRKPSAYSKKHYLSLGLTGTIQTHSHMYIQSYKHTHSHMYIQTHLHYLHTCTQTNTHTQKQTHAQTLT